LQKVWKEWIGRGNEWMGREEGRRRGQETGWESRRRMVDD
jgi:hypothetical protein